MVDVAELGELIGTPRRALAVVAHPDDESFGLGAILAGLVDSGTDVEVVCLTRGEASTLGAGADLGACRDRELRAAGAALGVDRVTLLKHSDGHLGDVAPGVIDAAIDAHGGTADLIVVFEPGGVTGHPDHRAASAAGRRFARRQGAAVLEWGVTPAVAAALHDELGASFVGLDDAPGATVIDVDVDRCRQLQAIACHGSQATDNVVLTRRLELQGSVERVRYFPADVNARPDRR